VFHELVEKSWGDPMMVARVTVGKASANAIRRSFNVFIVQHVLSLSFSVSVHAGIDTEAAFPNGKTKA
jgi:hypothetical protein